MSSSDNRSTVRNFLMWLGIYLFISIGISFIFNFPTSLVIFFLVFLIIQFVRIYYRNKKTGMKARDIFSSSSSSMFGFRPVKYYCMNCGTPHNLRGCPKCGSKMKRVG